MLNLEPGKEGDVFVTAKQYLKKAKRIDSFIKAKEEELFMLRSKADSIGSPTLSADKVQSTPNPTRLQDNIIAIIECEEKIQESINRLKQLHSEITDKIEALENDDHKLLLMLRYLNLKEWKYIATEMNFSESHILYLHKQALQAFEEEHKDFLSKIQVSSQ